MKNFFRVREFSLDMNVALLLLRLFVGYAFIMHGYGKIQNPFGWMPPESPVPGFLQFLAALSEFGGGIALILGLLTRLASLGLFFTMLVAAGFHLFLLGDPLINLKGTSSAEPALTFLFIALLLIVSGPGTWSLDKKIFGAT